MQIAKAFGAQVTGVCSARNQEQALSIGADHVVDYSREDFTRRGLSYDLICDIVGNHSISAYKRVMKPNGTCLIVGFAGNPLLGLAKFSLLGRLSSIRGSKKVSFMGMAKINAEDLGYIAELLEAGKVKPVLENRDQLSEAARALQYIGEKHTRGKNVVVMA